ncbi:hypothetical protein Bca4012_089509 [Brassica carinata]
MMQSEHNEHLSATLVKIELGTPTEPLQSQVIVLHRSRENNTSTGNPRLLSEVQVLKNTMNEHSKVWKNFHRSKL